MDTVHYTRPPAHAHTARRALGEATRGKTAPNRLRRVDTLVLLYARELMIAPYVDLGFGDTPTTTLESAARFRAVNPHLPVVGVEIDRLRVENAQAFADPQTHFRHGGFNLPLGTDREGRPEKAGIIRCMNVLRQYGEEAVRPAWSTLASYLVAGGLLVEGTSNANGSLFVANLLRAQPGGEDSYEVEGLVFSSNLRHEVEPRDFMSILPKNLIHRVVIGEPIHTLLADWQRAHWRSLGGAVWGRRWRWRDAARGLAADGYHVDLRPGLVDRGYLVVKGAR